jgi:hypothetical protein
VTEPAAITKNTSVPYVAVSQRAVIDPITHRLDGERSIPNKNYRARADARTAARRDIVVTEHPDGSKSADLGEAYMTTLEARIVDGELVTCHERRWTRE